MDVRLEIELNYLIAIYRVEIAMYNFAIAQKYLSFFDFCLGKCFLFHSSGRKILDANTFLHLFSCKNDSMFEKKSKISNFLSIEVFRHFGHSKIIPHK